MAGETVITIIGNLAGDPELRILPTGAQVTSFTVASTPRALDRASNEWRDGETLWMRCSIWRQPAEHVAESLTKGARVIVVGRLKQHSYEKDGQKRTVVELDVEEIGPSLRFATAKVVRAARGTGPTTGDQWSTPAGRTPAGAGAARSAGSTVDDPWAPPAGGYSDEPPF
ncbi:single-stranded DNA-binding protein [Pseudofrankia sp. DC12]|uniref:single-stranded DNA-binding protein n=1 Tax=Pseudofrankia sp. DC12 TaxID=683315 RepID=UPI0005F823B9|nr:single-stranded DNA-binding protein [Pseudofrankia sp. DC12]